MKVGEMEVVSCDDDQCRIDFYNVVSGTGTEVDSSLSMPATFILEHKQYNVDIAQLKLEPVYIACDARKLHANGKELSLGGTDPRGIQLSTDELNNPLHLLYAQRGKLPEIQGPGSRLFIKTHGHIIERPSWFDYSDTDIRDTLKEHNRTFHLYKRTEGRTDIVGYDNDTGVLLGLQNISRVGSPCEETVPNGGTWYSVHGAERALVNMVPHFGGSDDPHSHRQRAHELVVASFSRLQTRVGQFMKMNLESDDPDDIEAMYDDIYDELMRIRLEETQNDADFKIVSSHIKNKARQLRKLADAHWDSLGLDDAVSNVLTAPGTLNPKP